MNDQLPNKVFPDVSYACDAPNQVLQTKRTHQRETVFYVCILIMVVAFVMILVGTCFALNTLYLLGAATMILTLLVTCFMTFTWSAKLQCSSCQHRFSKERVPMGRQFEVFLVCKTCKTYVYTHTALQN